MSKNHKSNSREDEFSQDIEEKNHFLRIIKAFLNYNDFCKKRINIALDSFDSLLNDRQKSYVTDFESNCVELQKCVDANYEIIKKIVENVDCMFENQSLELDSDNGNDEKAVRIYGIDMDKVLSTLKQIAREWSDDGLEERESCYTPFLNDLKMLFPSDKYNLSEITVLQPGSGLGRLVYEIAKLGFCCQGNEFSLHMLFTSNFILNKCDKQNLFTIYPWVNQWCNNYSFNDQIRPITFPDINPFDLAANNHFSMAAGDFLDIYNDFDEWDAVATCFFIDTAHNVIDYIEKIYHLLKPGGYWLNLGPLLYHHSDLSDEKSVEFNYDQIKSIITRVGFSFIKEELHVKATYTENSKSMLKHVYDCVYFIARKP